MRIITQNRILLYGCFMLIAIILISACSPSKTPAAELNQCDSVSRTEDTDKELIADTQINQTAGFYAGISKEGIEMSAEDSVAWERYSKEIAKSMEKLTSSTLAPMDSLMSNEMNDLRKKCNYVFYPFSGADFIFPYQLFPDADIYFMIGLENVGTTIKTLKTDFKQYDSYRNALKTYYENTYFTTKDMKVNLNTDEIDGTVPVISMLMASDDCEIISAHHMAFADDGHIENTDSKTRLMEIKFFRKGSKHLQTLYYFSANINDRGLEENFQMYMDKVMPQYHVVTYLKTADYLMRRNDFVRIRTNILDHSMAVIQDDSGIPFRHFDMDKWNFTFYGRYVKPQPVFDADAYQEELMEEYNDSCNNIHPLNFNIGYSRPSNWMVARRTKKQFKYKKFKR